MARMPCRAQASMISTRSPCLRSVAVFSDSQRWSDEKSLCEIQKTELACLPEVAVLHPE